MENKYLREKVLEYSEATRILSKLLIRGGKENNSKLLEAAVRFADNEAIFALEYYHLTGKNFYSRS